jgi:hypothetical protein
VSSRIALRTAWIVLAATLLTACTETVEVTATPALPPPTRDLPTALPTASPSTAGEDCIPYDPGALRIVDEGKTGWVLTSGRLRMVLLDSEQDAQAALALAQRHTAQCFIGRDNTRSDRMSYIVEYWAGNSGVETTIRYEDCLPYNADALRIVDEGYTGWLLTDGGSRMLMLDNEQDAKAALTLAQQYSAHCFIGRGNTRPDRESYIVEYWQR